MLRFLAFLTFAFLGVFLFSFNNNKKPPGHESENNPEEVPVTELRINSAIPYSNILTNYTNTGLGYQAGAINCLVVSRTDSNLVLAGSNNGGVWISHNAAHSWQPVNDTASSLCVTSIAQNYFRDNEFYYSSGVDIYVNGVLQFDIYRSTDFGQTFSNVNAVSAPRIGRIQKILCSQLDSNTLYVLNYSPFSGGAVYRTTDDCHTFQQVYSSASAIDDIILLPDGTVEIGYNHSVWRSTTGNAGTFIQSTGIGTGYNVRMAFCASQPNIQYCTVYLFGGYDYYKSTDSGQTWNLIFTGANGLKIAVKPDNPDFVFAGGVWANVSLDGGLTWQYTFGGHDYRSFNFDPHRVGKVYCTSDFGINIIEVDPVTPSSFNIEYNADSMLYSQEAYYGDHAASGLMSLQGYQDLGSRFIQTLSSSRTMMAGDGTWAWISKQNPDIGYFTAYGGDLYRSDHMTTTNLNVVSILNQLDADNNGHVDEGTQFNHPYIMNNANDSQLYFPTFTRLWRSLDRGNNWTPVSGPKGNNMADITIACTHKPNPIVYWTNSDSVFVFANAATAAPFTEWGRPVPFDPGRSYQDPDNDSALYVINRAYPSQISYCINLFNPSSAWTTVPLTGLTDITVQCMAVYPGNNQVILLGTKQGGLYVTLNRGLTWTKEAAFPNVQITEIKIRPADKKVFIFTYGRGTWTADFSAPLSVTSVENVQKISVYPNPFNDQLTIETPQDITGTISLTDMQGKLCIKRLVSGRQTIINTNDLVAGVYMVTVADRNKILCQTKAVRVNR